MLRGRLLFLRIRRLGYRLRRRGEGRDEREVRNLLELLLRLRLRLRLHIRRIELRHRSRRMRLRLRRLDRIRLYLRRIMMARRILRCCLCRDSRPLILTNNNNTIQDLNHQRTLTMSRTRPLHLRRQHIGCLIKSAAHLHRSRRR